MIDQKIIIRYLEGDLHPSEAKELLNWLKSSPEALGEFTDIKEQWLTKHTGDRDTELAWQRIRNTIKTRQETALSIVGNSRRSNVRQLFFKALSYAAMIALTVLSTWFIVTKVQEKGPYSDGICVFIAPKGEKCQVILPDSSIVKLNSGSVLKMNPGAFQRNRIVELEGEGYFNVRSDHKNPFAVKTADYDVIATGTTFNIRAYNQINQSEVTLVEGTVTVESNDESVSLSQGEKAVYSKSHLQKDIANQNISLSWIRDEFSFSQTSFSELMFTLENWFNVEIIFDKTAFDYSYSGTFKNRETVEQILDAIRKYEDISYSKVENTIYIKSPETN
jgi:ferric-dicitrate binding protein FerR (iron transport regulator)